MLRFVSATEHFWSFENLHLFANLIKIYIIFSASVGARAKLITFMFSGYSSRGAVRQTPNHDLNIFQAQQTYSELQEGDIRFCFLPLEGELSPNPNSAAQSDCSMI